MLKVNFLMPLSLQLFMKRRFKAVLRSIVILLLHLAAFRATVQHIFCFWDKCKTLDRIKHFIQMESKLCLATASLALLCASAQEAKMNPLKSLYLN